MVRIKMQQGRFRRVIGWSVAALLVFVTPAAASDATITDGPAESTTTTDTTPTFTFASTDAASTFECALAPVSADPLVFGACSGPDKSHTPATALTPNTQYQFAVRATDAGVAGTPAVRTFTVVPEPAATPVSTPTPAPTATISTRPSVLGAFARGGKREATLTVTLSDAGILNVIMLRNGLYEGAMNLTLLAGRHELRTPRLKPGKYKFTVFAYGIPFSMSERVNVRTRVKR